MASFCWELLSVVTNSLLKASMTSDSFFSVRKSWPILISLSIPAHMRRMRQIQGLPVWILKSWCRSQLARHSDNSLIHSGLITAMASGQEPCQELCFLGDQQGWAEMGSWTPRWGCGCVYILWALFIRPVCVLDWPGIGIEQHLEGESFNKKHYEDSWRISYGWENPPSEMESI